MKTIVVLAVAIAAGCGSGPTNQSVRDKIGSRRSVTTPFATAAPDAGRMPPVRQRSSFDKTHSVRDKLGSR